MSSILFLFLLLLFFFSSFHCQVPSVALGRGRCEGEVRLQDACKMSHTALRGGEGRDREADT